VSVVSLTECPSVSQALRSSPKPTLWVSLKMFCWPDVCMHTLQPISKMNLYMRQPLLLIQREMLLLLLRYIQSTGWRRVDLIMAFASLLRLLYEGNGNSTRTTAYNGRPFSPSLQMISPIHRIYRVYTEYLPAKLREGIQSYYLKCECCITFHYRRLWNQHEADRTDFRMLKHPTIALYTRSLQGCNIYIGNLIVLLISKR